MSLNDQHDLGEYAPTPKRRVTRARKALIAVMAIGAFAATSGAGTFASFTASTDNASSPDTNGDNPFQTGEFELLNTVIDHTGAAIVNNGPDAAVDPDSPVTPGVDDLAACSSGRDDSGIGGLATDNHAECDLLFTGAANDVINGIKSFVKIENAGDTETGDGELILYVPTDGICELGVNTGSTTSNCDDVYIEIQEYIGSDGTADTPGTGNATPAVDGTDWAAAGKVSECVFGAIAAYADSDRNADTATDTDNACIGGRPLSELPQLTDGAGDITAYVTIDAVLPAADETAANTNENNDVRYFRIFAKMPPQDCGTATTNVADFAAVFSDDDTPSADGFHDGTGLGCHNSLTDTSSRFTLRWMLIG